MDALKRNFGKVSKSKILIEVGLEKDSYILATLHRAENVDDPIKLASLILALRQIRDKTDLEILFPIHPRTKMRIESYGISIEGLFVTNPFGYYDFLNLEANAKVIVTDSGGVQEEACILGVPCVTARNNTERPETVDVGANLIAGTETKNIVHCASIMTQRKYDWNNPFGNGDSSSKILTIIDDLVLHTHDLWDSMPKQTARF